MTQKFQPKFIFITGGVVSSLGKGVIAASIGALLESRGLKIAITKADPYINLDPGTMSPIQHGEVFVTTDGAETDLDIGHYERFTHANVTRANSFSSGQIYDQVLSSERRGDYLGKTVQVVPHITEQIKRSFFRGSEGADVSIIEIGGTVGDIECLPFLEAIRQVRYEIGMENVISVHLTLVPYIGPARELKTKPTQHSVKELRSIGIQPDILVCRANREVPTELLEKIASFCNVKSSNVFSAPDVPSIYEIPVRLHEQGFDQIIVERLGMWTRNPDLAVWYDIVERIRQPERECKIAIVGKYVDVIDSYKSLEEALQHGGIACRTKVTAQFIDAMEVNEENLSEIFANADGIVVPGGFGARGKQGKMLAIQYARENNIPFLGICLGMQLAAIEFSKNILQLKDVNSYEFDPDSEDLVVNIMADQKNIEQKGGTMRLGNFPCTLREGSLLQNIYRTSDVMERHRHRYEFNRKYSEVFENSKMQLTGTSPCGSYIEAMELEGHPWFIGCQYHPELQSKPMKPHPLFSSLVRTANIVAKERLANEQESC